MKYFLSISLLFLPFFAYSAGTVNFVEIDEDVILFSTSEAKTNAIPPCVSADNTSIWSISLESQSGRATYSMLVTAAAVNKAVNVETANDCGVLNGVERAKRVWFAVSE